MLVGAGTKIHWGPEPDKLDRVADEFEDREYLQSLWTEALKAQRQDDNNLVAFEFEFEPWDDYQYFDYEYYHEDLRDRCECGASAADELGGQECYECYYEH